MTFSQPNQNHKTNSRLFLVVWPVAAVLVLLSIFVFVNPSWAFLLQILFLLVLLVLIVQNEVLGLLALVVLRPMVDVFGTSVVLNFWGFSFSIAPIFSLIAIGWAIVQLFPRRAKLIATPLFWPIAAFLLIAAFGVALSVDRRVSLEEFLRVTSIFSLFMVAYHVITTPQTIRRFRLAFGLSLVAPSMIGVVQFVTHTGLSFGDVTNRIFGTFAHPNVFAFFLVLAIAFFVGDLYSEQTKRIRQGVAFGLIGLVVLLALTLTRGAWLGLLIVIATIGLGRYRRALATIAVIIFILGATFPITNRVLTAQFNLDVTQLAFVRRLTDTQSQDSSYKFRVQLWREMAPKFWERPILGHGLGTFSKLREQQTFFFFQGTEAHNDYLRLAIETGVLGLAAYLTLIGMVCVSLWRVVRRLGNYPDAFQALGLLGFTFALLVMSIFDNLLQSTPVMWIFWIALAVTLRQAAYVKE